MFTCAVTHRGQLFLTVLAAVLTVWASGAAGQPAVEDEAKAEIWAGFLDNGIVYPDSVAAEAGRLFVKDLDNQSVEELQTLAKRANLAANMIGVIEQEYGKFYSEHKQSRLVIDKLQPFYDKYYVYMRLMESYRNEAYYNLGLKAEKEGDLLYAFLYFRDAFRLAVFDIGNDPDGVRYRSEIALKRMMGLERFDAYLTWK